MFNGSFERNATKYTSIQIPFIPELQQPTMTFEADQTVQKYAHQTEMVLLSVSGSPGLLLALLPPCWRPSPLRIAAELLAAAQLTVSSICFHSLGQDSLLCSSDTFSRRAAQCNYTVRGGWFSEMWLAPSLLHLLKLFPPLSHHVFIHCSLLWSEFICVKGRHQKGVGIFFFFFSRQRVFILLLEQKKQVLIEFDLVQSANICIIYKVLWRPFTAELCSQLLSLQKDPFLLSS